MELTEREVGKRGEYLEAYDVLIGDERTRRTFQGTIEGIIGGESLCAAKIARFSPRNGNGKVW